MILNATPQDLLRNGADIQFAADATCQVIQSAGIELLADLFVEILPQIAAEARLDVP